MKLQLIQQKIFLIRGQRVMLDFHLAQLYHVQTRALKQAVRRNRKRFPRDFMFQLLKKEWKGLLKNRHDLRDELKHSPASPFAFTEQGIAIYRVWCVVKKRSA